MNVDQISNHIQKFLDVLMCPRCGGEFSIISKSLVCGSCNSSYLIVNGIPRFVENDAYVESFSLEWLTFPTTQLARKIGEAYQIMDFELRTGLAVKNPPAIALEAGCGAGRHTELLARHGWRLISVDLSKAVESAYENVKDYDNVLVIQADLNSLPLKAQAFDVVFSLGVLHHTPNPFNTFRSIKTHLKLGGSLSVSVYSDEGILIKLRNRIGDVYRWFGKRLKHESLLKLDTSFLNIFKLPEKYYTPPLDINLQDRQPGWKPKLTLANIFAILVPPLSFAPDLDWRILDTFDYLTPTYASYHTYSEVTEWFKREGFSLIENLRIPVSVKGILT